MSESRPALDDDAALSPSAGLPPVDRRGAGAF
jgi:hypothetical protein